MQIAQVLAGYTLGAADLLRRAMGKKKPEEMAKQRTFVSDARDRGVSEQVAHNIFDLMEKFAGYGFNKSHAAAYAFLSYQTAWLKTHYPAQYMAAVLSADMDHTDKVVRIIEDCKKMQLTILPPDINQGHYRFIVENEKIIYGLGAIKGIGQGAIENCLENRSRCGPFKDLFDFCQRVDTRKVTRRVFESLIRSGAMDSFGVGRASLIASLEKALQQAEQKNRDEKNGQQDLFSWLGNDALSAHADYILVDEWGDDIRLLGEKETLGLYLTGHPISKYEKEISQLITAKIGDLKPNKDKSVTVAGLVIAIRSIFTKTGNRMGIVTLDDKSSRIELIVFSDLFAQCKDLLEKDSLIIVEGEVSIDEFTEGYRLTGRKIMTLDQIRLQAKGIELSLEATHCDENFIQNLNNLLGLHRGGQCEIFICYKNAEGSARLLLGQEWQVKITQQLMDQLHHLCGKETVSILYSTT